MHQIHESKTRYDLILHIGVSHDNPGVNEYTLETNASRDSYATRDMTQLLPEDQAQPVFWKTSPPKIRTGARIEDVISRWASDVPVSYIVPLVPSSTLLQGHYHRLLLSPERSNLF